MALMGRCNSTYSKTAPSISHLFWISWSHIREIILVCNLSKLADSNLMESCSFQMYIIKRSHISKNELFKLANKEEYLCLIGSHQQSSSGQHFPNTNGLTLRFFWMIYTMVNNLDPSDGIGQGSSFLLKLYTIKGRKFLEYLSKCQLVTKCFHRTVTSYDKWILSGTFLSFILHLNQICSL